MDRRRNQIFESLKGSKSQAFQESFVQNVLNFKVSGHFLEIGAGDGVEANNTLLLERRFKWAGLSVELDPQLHQDFLNSRKTMCLCEDATVWDSESYLKSHSFPNRIDYLQIDIDPASQSLQALINLPLDNYRFSVITFEHDYYVDQNPQVRDASREILVSSGYHLFFAGVQTRGRNFEDWWLDPEVAELKKYLDFQYEDREAEELFFHA
jgi:disulfide oxidoreductase YuzD